MKTSQKAARKGFFITFEGPEGAGKTTQLERLEQHLRKSGRSVFRTREPGGTELAEKLRSIVKEHQGAEVLHDQTELLLLEAARCQHVLERIKPALERGEIVLCDRFTDSTTAYQGVARNIGIEPVTRLNEFATAGCPPDLTILLDLPPEKGFERTRKRVSTQGAFDRFEAEKITFHRQVREAFLAIAEREPGRVRVVNADDTPEHLEQQIAEIVDEFL